MTDNDEQPDFDTIGQQLKALLAGEDDPLANVASFVALLNDSLSDINWLGIYVLRDRELVLGPFQGKPACIRIPVGQGVCGAAIADLETLRVADVHDFEGHIICDPESRSEIVVPLIRNGQALGVLDIDSPKRDRFSSSDQAGIQMLCDAFVATLPAQRFI